MSELPTESTRTGIPPTDKALICYSALPQVPGNTLVQTSLCAPLFLGVNLNHLFLSPLTGQARVTELSEAGATPLPTSPLDLIIMIKVTFAAVDSPCRRP
jgi:hypothetical protein